MTIALEDVSSWALVAIVVVTAVGLAVRHLLFRLVAAPMDALIEAGRDLRIRGSVHHADRRRLATLARRRDRTGELARTLVAVEEEINRRFVELSTLLETARRVASSLDVGAVFATMLAQIRSLFDVDACAIITLDERAGEFRIRASLGLPDEYVREVRIAPSSPNSPSMRALRNGTPVQVVDTLDDLAYGAIRNRVLPDLFRSRLSIPLMTMVAPPAVLLLYKSGPYRYSFAEMELASTFAAHASVAMENAALHARTDERLHEQTSRLEAIVESLADGLVLEDPAGRVLVCNRTAARMVGLDPEEARARPAGELLATLVDRAVDRAAADRELAAAHDGTGTGRADLRVRGDAGRDQDLRLHVFDVTDATGARLGRGHLWQDISDDKALDRMKSALVGTVSHELRSPLALIKGYASTLLADDVSWAPDDQREFLETISTETDRLTRLVQDLLDVSRIEAGALEIACEPQPVNEILHRAVGGFPLAVRGRVRLALATGLPLVDVDASRVETVVHNLLDNAVKYGPNDRPIELTTRLDDGRVVVSVRDHGPGVSPELGDRVFDRFVRADNRLARQVGGVGIGLAICRGFVEAHGGRLWMEPAQPGTTFTFSLPVAATAAVAS